MKSVLSCVKKRNTQRVKESDADYEHRMLQNAYMTLSEKEDRSESEKQELKDVVQKLATIQVTEKGALSRSCTDVDLQPAATKLYKDLSKEFGEMTPMKHMLLDRLVSAWSLSVSHERLFSKVKYNVAEQEDGSASLSYSHTNSTIKLLQETRKGMEAANDQIIRLTQALKDYSSPPVHVKVKNAFIAQNQQFNDVLPKNLEN